MRPVSVRTPHEVLADYQNHHDADVTAGVPEAPQHSQSNASDRGYVGGRTAPVTAFAWMSAIKMGSKREGSSGPGSGGESADPSRVSSRSRPSSIHGESSHTPSEVRKSNDTKGKSHDEHREGDTNQSLQDEYVGIFGCCLNRSHACVGLPLLSTSSLRRKSRLRRYEANIYSTVYRIQTPCSSISPRRGPAPLGFTAHGVKEHRSLFVSRSLFLETIPKPATQGASLKWTSRRTH